MKQKNYYLESMPTKNLEQGFTLLEMLFVVGILAVFYGLILTNFNSVRVSHNLKNGQNELMSTIQRIRSYSLSGRQMMGNAPKYYILKIEAPGAGGNTRQYVVQGVAQDASTGLDRVYDGSGNPNLETVPLPQVVSVKSMELTVKGVAAPAPVCAQIIFSVPYGKTYINENCANLTALYTNPVALSDRSNSRLTITLQRDGTTDEKKVVVYGLSGRVEKQ